MSSKLDILNRIRRHTIQAPPLPTLEGTWITFDDPVRQFVEVLGSVGGQAVMADSPSDLERTVRDAPAFAGSRQIVCGVPGIGVGTVALDEVADPHALADIDVAVLPGEFAVAENGAVWVTDRGLRHRAIYFIAQHVVLVVPRAQVIHNLHQAYDRLHWEEIRYGLFISGPSKTADIEQSLVIGAHGPRSLTVVLTDFR